MNKMSKQNPDDISDFVAKQKYNMIRKSWEEEKTSKISEDIQFIVTLTGCSKYEAELALENNCMDALTAAKNLEKY